MMKASLRCLTLGLLSLMPFIGAPFAIAALYASYSAHKMERHFWTPARRQRILGLICAAAGALIWGGVDTILVYRALYPY